MTFLLGTFINSAKKPVNVSLNIFNNGITAETTSSTDDVTEFLQDLTTWMTKEFGFRLPSDLTKAYFSQLTVELDAAISTVNPRLQVISKMLSADAKALDGKPRQFEVGAVNFWSEDVGASLAPSICRIERKWGVPFSNNQYFSIAPLDTQQHLNLLKEVEKILNS